jgi:hypothetical protein
MSVATALATRLLVEELNLSDFFPVADSANAEPNIENQPARGDDHERGPPFRPSGLLNHGT